MALALGPNQFVLRNDIGPLNNWQGKKSCYFSFSKISWLSTFLPFLLFFYIYIFKMTFVKKNCIGVLTELRQNLYLKQPAGFVRKDAMTDGPVSLSRHSSRGQRGWGESRRRRDSGLALQVGHLHHLYSRFYYLIGLRPNIAIINGDRTVSHSQI